VPLEQGPVQTSLCHKLTLHISHSAATHYKTYATATTMNNSRSKSKIQIRTLSSPPKKTRVKITAWYTRACVTMHAIILDPSRRVGMHQSVVHGV
jgi:hypothetical protein